MKEFIPEDAYQEIAKQLKISAIDPVQNFDDARGDEDSITGTLIQSIGHYVKGESTSNGTHVKWKTSLRKLRGRGNSAPEKRFGADAILETEISIDGEIVARKALPIQSKTEWHGTDSDLLKQCREMSSLPSKGIAVNYTKNGYYAIDCDQVIEHKGNHEKAKA